MPSIVDKIQNVLLI